MGAFARVVFVWGTGSDCWIGSCAHPPLAHSRLVCPPSRARQAASPNLSVKDARARIEQLATPGVYTDDKAFVHFVHDSAAAIEKEIASVKQASVKARLASLLDGLSADEKKQVLSGL